MKQKRISAQILKGFQDFFPEDMIARTAVIERIRKVYERFGFLQMDTPVLESLETLTGSAGLDVNKEIFTLTTPEGEAAALRFDLTVPFARLVSQYRDQIKLPFRRYHVGPVFRADKPGPGRYRQFTQFDIDIAGARSLAADAEIIAVLCEAMRALGLRQGGEALYRVRISNRQLLDALFLDNTMVDAEKIKHTLRVIDKLSKVGLDNVRAELGKGRMDDSGDPIPGVHLSESLIENIITFIGVTAATRNGVVEALKQNLPETSEAENALNEMSDLAIFLDAQGISETEAVFDPSLTRGLDYYTGPVFEIEIAACPYIGSVGGGGRYNELCSRFLAQEIPATGASIGLDRLMLALRELSLLSCPKSTAQVCIATVGKVAPVEVMKLASELRAAGYNTLTYLGGKKNMAEQLSDADRYEIPVAVILGEDELQRGEVSVKNLIAGKQMRSGIVDHDAYLKAGRLTQVTVKRSEVAETIREVLEERDDKRDITSQQPPAKPLI
ncbi:MAG: Histidine--tRNA ligase [Candidatus Hydrogenedentes bacterium ADurb.Bin179]|nr:MAG: Histidine--tRNA ligase [Candidatus Hydrogenedentes bacterium ADurb.Bin179]